LLSPHLSRLLQAGEGAYGVRKRSFRLMLKLTLQHSKNGCFPFSQAGEGAYGVRKRSFRLMLKLTLQHSKNGCFPFSQAGEGAYGVRKRSFRLMLKLTLQHSKNGCFPFSQAGEGGLYQSPSQSSQKIVFDNPLLKVPPARRGNRTGALLGSPREAGGT